jgi:hypothetical protein
MTSWGRGCGDDVTLRNHSYDTHVSFPTVISVSVPAGYPDIHVIEVSESRTGRGVVHAVTVALGVPSASPST